MKWGVLENTQTRERHALPTSNDDEVLNNHVAARDCWCQPKDSDGLVLHNDSEHGELKA